MGAETSGRHARVTTLARSRVIARRAAVDFPPTVVQELQQLEADLGGRQQIVGMLALAPLSEDLRYMLGLLGDPQHQGKSLAEICAIGNTLPAALLKELAAAALLRGRVRASQIIGSGIVKVAEDVMRRAAPYEAPCEACQGTGSLTADPTPTTPNPSPAPCETCRGTGRLLYSPDLERQKLAVDLAQLLPKGGGIQIAQINGAAPSLSGGQGMVERLQAFTDRVLYGEPAAPQAQAEDPPVEGEILPAAGDTPA